MSGYTELFTGSQKPMALRLWRSVMQYQHIGYGIRGFYRAALRQAGGNPTALVPRSSAPRTRRAPHWPTALVEQIRHLRTEYPNLGKAKVHALLADWCRQHAIPLPSVSTIGRIIAKDPHQMRHAPTRLSHKGRRKPVRRNRKNRQPKGQKHPPLSVFACDTVIRVRDGIRRYLFTFIDPNSRFAIAFAARSPSSRQATFALEALCQLLPTPPPRFILSDNGSEFKGQFEDKLQQYGITHWWTYPRSPKMKDYASYCTSMVRSVTRLELMARFRSLRPCCGVGGLTGFSYRYSCLLL